MLVFAVAAVVVVSTLCVYVLAAKPNECLSEWLPVWLALSRKKEDIVVKRQQIKATASFAVVLWQLVHIELSCVE